MCSQCLLQLVAEEFEGPGCVKRATFSFSDEQSASLTLSNQLLLMTTIQPPVCPTFIHLDETSPTPIACCCNEDRGCLVLVFNLCALLAPSSHPDLPLPVSTLSSANTCSHSPFRRRWLAQVPSIAQPLTSAPAILALASDPAPCLLFSSYAKRQVEVLISPRRGIVEWLWAP